MLHNKNIFLGCILALVIALNSSHAAKNEIPMPRVGVNVEGIHKLNSSLPFTDLFKVFTGWFTSCEFDWQKNIPIDPGCSRSNSFNTREQGSLKLDKNGWVRALPHRDAAEIYTSVVSGLNPDSNLALGRYVLLYSGEGDIEVLGGLNIVEKRPGKIVFDLIAVERGIKVKINKTHHRKYIRDIHLVAIANEKNFRQEPFDQNYLERMRPFDAIRFMAWTNPRVNDLSEWDSRPGPDFAHYTGKTGVPVEMMLDLVSRTGASPWLNMPYKASDDFIRNYARLARKKVRSNQKVYVELSNEMWNVIFPATAYAIQEAQKLWPGAYSTGNVYVRKVKLANNWYGKRSVEMCNIWKQVFKKKRDQVVCIIASQSNIDWVGKEALDCPLWRNGPCGSHVDAYAVGPYFGDYIAKLEHRERVKNWANLPNGLDLLFKEIEQGSVLPEGPKGGAIQHFVDSNMKVSMQLADDYGLPLLAYEAGQHLIRYDPPHKVTDLKVLDFFMRANQDPRMKHAYQRYLQAWEEGGGKTLMHFYGIGKPTPTDFFAMLPSSATEESPKYNALLAYKQISYKDKYQHAKPLSYRQLEERRGRSTRSFK